MTTAHDPAATTGTRHLVRVTVGRHGIPVLRCPHCDSDQIVEVDIGWRMNDLNFEPCEDGVRLVGVLGSAADSFDRQCIQCRSCDAEDLELPVHVDRYDTPVPPPF